MHDRDRSATPAAPDSTLTLLDRATLGLNALGSVWILALVLLVTRSRPSYTYREFAGTRAHTPHVTSFTAVTLWSLDD